MKKNIPNELRNCLELAQVSSDAFLFSNVDGCISFLNSVAEELTGFTTEKACGLGLNEILPYSSQSNSSAIHEIMERVIKSQTLQGPLECNFEIPNSTDVICFELTSIPLILACGELHGIMWICRHMSISKEQSKELQLMRFAFDRASDPILWTDENKYIIYANDAACVHVGYTQKEILQLTLPDISVSHDRKQFTEKWKALYKIHHVRYESSHRHKSGEIIPIEISLDLFELNGRKYICAMVKDFRERQLFESKFEKSEKISRLLKNIAFPAN